MEVSRFLAENGAPHGTVITADFQEAGRGRTRERRWEMERGIDLAFTVLLRFGGQTPSERQGVIPTGLTLRTGLAAALAIEDFAPALAGKALIKWPNDILLPVAGSDGKPAFLKTAGILTEAKSGNVHIGIGVNMARDRHRGKATSLSFAANAVYIARDRHRLLEKILSRLYDEIENVKGIENWRERVEARLFKKGGQICFAKGAADSGDTVTGILTGIGFEGELLVLPDGETAPRSFTTGELLFFR